MAIFKCSNQSYVSITQEILKKINGWKKIRLTLTKVFNHLKFIRKALKSKVLPVGFKKNLHIEVRNYKEIQWKVGKMLMEETVNELYRKQKRLLNEELTLRNYLRWKLREDEWVEVEKKVNEIDRKTFIETRSRQMAKMENLLSKNNIPEKIEGKDTKGRLINLSKYTLTKAEENLLLKGLDFIPGNNKIDKLDISVNVEGIMRKLNLQDKLLVKDVKKVFEEKDNSKDNLSALERKALQSLLQNQEIVIAYSDKGKVTLILDKDEYIYKLEEVIKGKDYEVLKKDPTNKIDKQIREIAKICKKDNEEGKMYYKIVGEDTRWPSVFGNMKIHKVGLPLRVIVSCCGTVTEKASQFVKTILNHYVENHADSNITLGITYMKKELQEMNFTLENDYILASIDVVNMFTNISTNKAFHIIKDKVESDKNFYMRTGIEAVNFLNLVKILLENSYFKYSDDFYRQKHGIPMGSGISPVVADLVMLDLEREMENVGEIERLKYYRRYRDDGFIIWKGSKGQLLEFLEDINCLDEEGNIKFTLEIETEGWLPFLDAKISRVGNKLKFQMYEKPFSAGMLMNFNSHQDISIKKSIIAGETTRCYRISDELEEDLNKLKAKLINNDYPGHLIQEVIAGTINKRKQEETNKKESETKYLGIKYPGKARAKKLKKIGKKFGFKMAFGKQLTLGNLFSNKFKYNTSRGKGLIYSVKCKCGKEYVGETGKGLNDRMKQHKYSISRMDVNNGIAMHVQDCNQGINWKEAQILNWEGNWFRRKLKESLWIELSKPDMNLTEGWKLRSEWQEGN